MSGSSLSLSGVEEEALSSRNASGLLLENWSTQIVCTGTRTHPDGARYVSNPITGVWCYQGVGAWLNDPNGIERRDPNDPYATTSEYYNTPQHRHVRCKGCP